MTRKHEMIRAKASIPIRVSSGYKIDVVYDSVFYRSKVPWITIIDESNHLYDTKREVENVCLLGIVCAKLFVSLNFMNKISLHGVYAPARTIMKQRRLPFFVHIYLKLFFHFQVAPVMTMESKLPWEKEKIKDSSTVSFDTI